MYTCINTNGPYCVQSKAEYSRYAQVLMYTVMQATTSGQLRKEHGHANVQKQMPEFVKNI
jgi:hypothetical protein